jgi:hypothetical protein
LPAAAPAEILADERTGGEQVHRPPVGEVQDPGAVEADDGIGHRIEHLLEALGGGVASLPGQFGGGDILVEGDQPVAEGLNQNVHPEADRRAEELKLAWDAVVHGVEQIFFE